MSRRLAAGLLAFVLFVVLFAAASLPAVPYVTFKPGPTYNALGDYDGKQIIQISGRKTYPDDGQLRFVTVYVSSPETKISLWGAIGGWLDPDVALVPRDAVYQENETNKSSRAQSSREMTTSQDAATAAALNALGIAFTSRPVYQVGVAQVEAGGPADGVLKKDDVILGVGGKQISTRDDAVAAISGVNPGSPVKISVLRDGATQDLTVPTGTSPDDPRKARVGVSLFQTQVGLDADFPFKVDINLDDRIGGPSAGMMFALSIYDLLTPGSLTGGRPIAGSGEISADGVVGSIGGIGQKIVGAQRDGARLFLVAEENCAEAARSHYDRSKIQLVKVHTLRDAIDDLEAWSKDPSAKLTGCTA